MTDRPDFILTAGERRADSEFDELDGRLENRYIRLACSRFKWTGLPDDVPEGWVDYCLYMFGGVGVKRTAIGDLVLPAAPVKRNVYGRPLTWVPRAAYAVGHMGGDLMSESDGPALITDAMQPQVTPWLETLRNAQLSLNMNVCSMRVQTAINGTDSFDLNGRAALDALKRGEPWVPAVGSYKGVVELLDTRPNDYTQALVNTIRAADAQILTLLGVMNSGTGRESGVTAMETDSVSQELEATLDRELALRQEWAERVSEYLGTTVTVERAEALIKQEPMLPEEGQDDEDGKDRDSD